MGSGGTRRQLTPIQQSHILSDIQQHQHRFAPQNQLFNPNTKIYSQKSPPNFVIEPSIQTQLPSETIQLPVQANSFYVNSQGPQPQALQGRYRNPNNLRSNENGQLHTQHHTQTNFVPNYSPSNVVFPQQPLFDRNVHQPQQHQPQQHQSQQHQPQQHQPQQVFQRSVNNQVGDPGRIIFKPSQPFPVQPPQIGAPNPTFDPSNNFGHPLQSVQTLQQNQLNQYPTNNPPPPNAAGPSNHPYQIFQNPQNKQQSQLNPAFFGDIHPDDPRYKDLLERQKIIQKHEHFTQRQQEKNQAKVRQLHQEFVQKQRRIKEQSIVNSKPYHGSNGKYFPSSSNSRIVSPYEVSTFERAVHNYESLYPTSSPSTTFSNTSPNPINEVTSRIKSSRANANGDISDDELELFLNSQRDKLFSQVNDKPNKKAKAKPTKALNRDDLLRQLKLALADQPADLGNQNYTTMEVVLPDGQKVQVIRTTDPNLVKDATALNADGTILSENLPQRLSEQPDMMDQKPLIEQAADASLIPPGSDFEVIRQTADGDEQAVGSLPNKKKVTFVYLEEQNDGSYKVQGVKSNGEKDAKTKGVEVDNIIDRIKAGEIQLPPTVSRRNSVSSTTPIETSSPASSTPFLASGSPSTHYMTSSATKAPTYSYSSSGPSHSSIAVDSGNCQFFFSLKSTIRAKVFFCVRVCISFT